MVISKLPYGYTQVDYLQGTGTQFIKYNFRSGGFKCKYKANWQVGGYVVGSHYQSEPYNRNGGYLHTINSDWELGYGDTYPQVQYSALANTNYEVEFATFSDNAYLKVNGNTIITTSGQTLESQYMYLFACGYYTNEQLSSGSSTQAKLYWCQIYDSSDNLVYDFIPCRNDSNNEIGLFDVVEGYFYGNSGSGTFQYGQLLNQSPEEIIYNGVSLTSIVKDGVEVWKPSYKVVDYTIVDTSAYNPVDSNYFGFTRISSNNTSAHLGKLNQDDKVYGGDNITLSAFNVPNGYTATGAYSIGRQTSNPQTVTNTTGATTNIILYNLTIDNSFYKGKCYVKKNCSISAYLTAWSGSQVISGTSVKNGIATLGTWTNSAIVSGRTITGTIANAYASTSFSVTISSTTSFGYIKTTSTLSNYRNTFTATLSGNTLTFKVQGGKYAPANACSVTITSIGYTDYIYKHS